MNKKEEILININSCKDLLTVADAVEVFCRTWYSLEKSTVAFEKVIKKVSKKAWIEFANTLLLSYLSALYLNCDIDEEEQIERLEELTEVFEGIIETIDIVRDEDTSSKKYDA